MVLSAAIHVNRRANLTRFRRRFVAQAIDSYCRDGSRFDAYLHFDGRNPVLQNDEIVLLGWSYAGSNSDTERETIIRRNIKVVELQELQMDPVAAAKRAIGLLGSVDRIVVHFDVDVIDFADCPLSENYRHGEGCSLNQAMAALSTVASESAFAGVTVTELNPDHGEEDLLTLKLFSERFAQALTGKLP